jgi:hypothetical protein
MLIILGKALLILILISLNTTFGQNEDLNCSDTVKTNIVQLANLGFGGAVDLKNSRFLNLGLSYHWKAKTLTYNAGINYSSRLLSGPEINNFHAGIGKSIIKRLYVAGITAGPGVTWGKEFNTSISLNSNAQVIFTPIKNLGVGVELFSNLNKMNNLFGLRIVIHLNDNKY